MNSTRTLIGPFNRVEGDLEIQLDMGTDRVREAWVRVPMYRGFEQIMQGKTPDDALIITPRICGICSVSQSVAAAYALADMANVTAPPNGQHCLNLLLACENLADHLTHFYLFFMPDFARACVRRRKLVCRDCRPFHCHQRYGKPRCIACACCLPAPDGNAWRALAAYPQSATWGA